MAEASESPSDVSVVLMGPFAIEAGGESRPVTRPREQTVLARLALAAPAPVSLEVLVDAVWGNDPPSRAVDALRVHVSNLRRLFDGAGRTVLVTAPGGYRLDLPTEAVDVGALAMAIGERDVSRIRALVGPRPPVDLGRFESGSGYFETAARTVNDLWLDGVETIARIDLAAGRLHGLVARLEVASQHAPFREPMWTLLIRSLHADGRRAEALRAFQRARASLAELGVEPGADLIGAERAINAPTGQAAGTQDPTGGVGSQRMETHYVDVAGSQIAYATLGSGELDLLFLHGGFIPMNVMPEAPRLASFLDRLSEQLRVVLLDRRGIGMSDPPADGRPIRLEHWVADCHAVLATLGDRPTIVLGHEHGGPVAIAMAAAKICDVRGLLLHSTAAKGLRSADHPYGPTEDALTRVARMIDRLPGAPDTLRLVAPSVGEDPPLRAWIERAGRLGASPSRAKELHQLYLLADVRHLLPDVAVPTTVLHPIRAMYGDPGRARYLADHLPNAELQFLNSADHLFWLGDAEAVHSAIDRLVERVTSPSAKQPLPRLRALVAVRGTGTAARLGELGAEVTIIDEETTVAIFATIAAADHAMSTLQSEGFDPLFRRQVADTTGNPDDPVIVDLVQALTQAG